VTYEDDLDILVVTFIRPCPDDEGYMGQVSLHDNQTGSLLKTISLAEYWDVVSAFYIISCLQFLDQCSLDNAVQCSIINSRSPSICHMLVL